MTIWIKSGVMGDLHPIMQKALGKIIDYYESKCIFDFFITSVRDGNHMPGSFHYIGLAVDFLKQGIVSKELIDLLGPDFDVIPESDHMHVEYDPER